MGWLMDIFGFAMQMEKEGESLYRRLANDCCDAGLAGILVMLADEEVRHQEVIADMRDGAPAVPQTTVLRDAVNVFRRMKESGRVFDFNVRQLDLYRKALDIENRSEAFYREMAEEVPETHQRDTFLKLAEEERKHAILMDNIVEFVSRPLTWLENAEWHHLEAY